MTIPTTSERSDRVTRFAVLIGRVIPDAMSTSIVLLVLVFAAALTMGNSLQETADAYYRGFWMLLSFTMQMTLILVLSSTLGATPFFRRIVVAMSRLPGSRGQVVAMAMLSSAALSYLYWGLGIALGPLVAIYFAREAESKGIAIDFPFLLAVTGAATSVWQFGFSASAPLLMNTPGHFLEQSVGLMPLRTTIFAPATIVFVIAFLVVAIAVGRLLMPKHPEPISAFPESLKLAAPPEAVAVEPADPDEPPSLSDRIERHRLPAVLLAISVAGWVGYHFWVKKGGLELNSLNAILLLSCLVFHRSVRSFTRALQTAVGSAWPVIVLYHLYAGVAGLIQYTTVGETFAGYFAAVSTRYTFPLLTALAAATVSVFVPSSGGQWVIQGFITSKTAAAVGVTAQRGLLALSVGDHIGNLISPFWVVIAAGIARVDFRRFIGYNLVFAALWFALGVLAFTFLPA